MYEYFGTSSDKAEVIEVTNADERKYLEGVAPDEQIGTRTYSCSYVEPTTSGGIQVKVSNLTYVTSSMISSTLLTSGVENCNVIAASPIEVSGTGALTGIMMALRDPTAVLRIVETLVLPRETQALVSEFLIYVSGNTSQVMFIAALFVMITSASAAFRAMAAIVSEIHGDKRFGIVSSTVVSVAFSVAFLLVLYLCVLLMLTGKRFLLWLDALMPRVSIIWSWTWVRFLVLFAILLMMILVLYRLTTPRRTPHRVFPGALFSAVGIVVMSILLSWLIGNSAKYSLVYGSLASVVILLFWFHVFGLLLIMGVVLNHALEVTAPPKKEG